MAQRNLSDLLDAASINSEYEHRAADYPPLPPGEAPMVTSQAQEGAASGKRRPRAAAGRMTTSPAASKQRESNLTHERLGTKPGVPPTQLPTKVRLEMAAAAIAAASAAAPPRAAAKAAAEERWATAAQPTDPRGRRPAIPVTLQPPGATGTANAVPASATPKAPEEAPMEIDDDGVPPSAPTAQHLDPFGVEGDAAAAAGQPIQPPGTTPTFLEAAALDSSRAGQPPDPPEAADAVEMEGQDEAANAASPPKTGNVRAADPTHHLLSQRRPSHCCHSTRPARRASPLLLSLALIAAVAATVSLRERRHFGTSRPLRVSLRRGQDLVPVRYSLPGNETPIPSGMITRVCDGELTIMGISTPAKRMAVIPIRKGPRADLGPWMNMVTLEAKTYLLDLASICVQLESGEELELQIQDCQMNGERPAPSAEQTREREEKRAERDAQRTAERRQEREEQRAAERARQIVISYDLPSERLGWLLEEKELEYETKLVQTRAAEVFGDTKHDVRFHQPEDDEYGYALNQFTAYLTLTEGATYADVADKDFTGLKFLPLNYASRPLMAYMPKGISDQLGIARCCFQAQAACDAGRNLAGKCGVKEVMLNPSKFHAGASTLPPLPPKVEFQRQSARDRKRARHEEARDSLAQAQLEKIRAQLCTKYVNGEVNSAQHARTAHVLRQPCPAVLTRRPGKGEMPRAPQTPQILTRVHRVPLGLGRILRVLLRDG